MQPPKNYKPGIGRGALGFSTRGGIGVEAAAPIDDGAAEIYLQVDKRRKKPDPKEAEPGQFEDAQISEHDWLSIPDATDTTFRNKRLRMEQQMQRRSYNLPDSMIETEPIRANFQRLTKVDPTNPEGWVGYARQEHEMQHYKKARSVIQKGTQKCPRSLQVWLLAIELALGLDEKRIVATRALEANPGSIDIWTIAVDIESNDTNKLKVVHRALEANPEHEPFWNLAASLEPDPETRKLVLEQAVNLVPGSELLWLEYYAACNQEQVLDKALGVITDSVPLWSAKLYRHEASTLAFLQDLVSKLPPGDWAGQIRSHPDSVRIAALLIEKFEINPCEFEEETLRGLAFKSLATRDASAYTEWARQGNKEALERVLEDGSEEAYELLARENTAEALERAYNAYPTLFADRYIAILEPQEAERVLALHKNKTPDQWLKYAGLLGSKERVQALYTAITAHPSAGQLYLFLSRYEPEWLAWGVEKAPNCPELWVEYSESVESIGKRRALLIQGLAANPRSELLWVARVLLEHYAAKDIHSLLEQALKECGSSGQLWYLYLEGLSGLKRKSKYAEALEKTNKDGHVLYSLAKFYQSRGKDARELLAQAGEKVEWCRKVDSAAKRL